MGTFIITFIVGLICLFVYHARRFGLYKKALQFPGPPVLPIVGNALRFLGNTEDILTKITELTNVYPSPFRVWIGPELVILISQPEHIKKVLNSDRAIEKAYVYKYLRPWLGNGLLSAPAAIWRTRRKLIRPTFNLKILESFVDVFAAQSKIMVERMDVEVNASEFEIFDYLSLCMLDIICETAMGVKMGAQARNGCDYTDAAAKAFAIAYQRIYKLWLHMDVIFNCTKLAQEQEECLETLHGYTNTVIRKKQAAFHDRNNQKNSINAEHDVDDLPSRRKAYLDLLMELRHDDMKLTDAELREEVDTMIVGGNDTTSNAMNYVMLMLAYHPDVQEKAYAELLEVFGNSDIEERSVTNEDLSRLEYLERVIKESLRIFPIAPTIARNITEDLDIGECVIPKGSSVFVPIVEVHRSEEHWPDPLKFDPDRFLPEEIAKRNPNCYLPFSMGPRNCIGFKFAMLEMKTVVATVLRKYVLKKDHLVPIRDIKLKCDTLLKPVEPITLRIERRTSEGKTIIKEPIL